MKMIINGRKVDASDGKKIEVFNSATGELVDTVPSANEKDIQKVMKAAQEGKKVWAETPLYERSAILKKYVKLLEKHKSEIAKLECSEMGKRIVECEAEASTAAKIFTGFIERANHICGDVMPDCQSECGKDLIFTRREPLGVIVCIVPFNYPVELFSHKVAPALIMGNVIIVKPATDNPLTVIRLMELLIEAGVPGNVAQVVTGRGSVVGNQLVDNPYVDAVSLTGSTEVGCEIAKKSSKYLHNVFLELGGNDAMIVMEDANIDFAVEEAMLGRVWNAGQTCCATKRIVVNNKIKEEFTKKLVARLDKVKRGNPSDYTTDIGYLISERAAIKAEEQVKHTIEQGAKCIYGGTRDKTFFEPTVLIDITSDMDVANDMEIFGPVIPIIGFDTEEEAIEITNAPIYGLQCGIVTNNTKKAINMAAKIQVGNVVINGTGNYRHIDMAFGGTKMTGIGREGVQYTLEEMSKVKSYVLKNILN
ncbi:succinate-semialdehyde dehydrogenase/glutarate-semialdehyde dehydrogenase [Clostridium algifaecis]|uniref:Succinate-semialdehyde dehydrogenase/glutarate-semialdehyde dehydrogenase n=1 Tax=Clostridium algifaecis TaxID=1472040 RepID=A0ABS4KWT3_9CLOT|nr:aldehyde dehydrogenase family protein [Clostridium algifaecis]MBP2033971.1 succinate-semialdehyde dehydrogenase/glutarate-semialdehyde dehydrogenase [Clostridium algifaecis]